MQNNIKLNATLLFGISVVLGTYYFFVTESLNKQKRNLNAVNLKESSQVREHSQLKVPRILAVTRIHKGSSTQMASVESVLAFVGNSIEFATTVLITIGIENITERIKYIDELEKSLLNADLLSRVILLPINPWGHFTFALNCAIARAVDDGFNVIAFQSLEFRISPEAVTKLVTYLQKDDVLVAGPAIAGHDFSEGVNALRGRTCPWNTFAVWNVEHLSLIGFPPVGDGRGVKRGNGGVEEVTAIALIQHVRPYLQAILVRMKGVEWKTDFSSDPVRAQYHENKMISKDARPADQMKRLGIQDGKVSHVIDDK